MTGCFFAQACGSDTSSKIHATFDVSKCEGGAFTADVTLRMDVPASPATWVPESMLARNILTTLRSIVVSSSVKILEMVEAYRFEHLVGFDACTAQRMAKYGSMMNIHRGPLPSDTFYEQCADALLLDRQSRLLLCMVKQQVRFSFSSVVVFR